jgi:hypothetical protein
LIWSAEIVVKTFLKVAKSGTESAPNFLIMSVCSIVAKTGLSRDDLIRPADFQSMISPCAKSDKEAVWLVMARMTTSGLRELYVEPDTTTAGRCSLVCEWKLDEYNVAKLQIIISDHTR